MVLDKMCKLYVYAFIVVFIYFLFMSHENDRNDIANSRYVFSIWQIFLNYEDPRKKYETSEFYCAEASNIGKYSVIVISLIKYYNYYIIFLFNNSNIKYINIYWVILI